jgi:nucleoid-associated protein YgaU
MFAAMLFSVPAYAEDAKPEDAATTATTETTKAAETVETVETVAAEPLSDACQKDLEKIRNHLETTQNTSQKLQSEWQQRLTSCETELKQTQQTLSAELDKQTETSNALTGCQKELAHAKQAGLKTRLAPAQGGSATADMAKKRAAKATEAYLARLKTVLKEKGDKYGDSVLLSTRRELLDAQHLLLQIQQGMDLYTIRRNDTLSVIATAVYGKGQRWKDIAEANQHVIPNPNQLEAGLTLMIPK